MGSVMNLSANTLRIASYRVVARR